MTFKIRYATPDDLEVCIAFDCTDPTDSRGDHEKADLIRAKITTHEIYLAVNDADKPIGYLTVDRLWPMMMPLLSWVYVAPAWRSNGIATQMAEHCFEDLKNRGYKRIMISTQTDRHQMLETLANMNLRNIGTLNANPDDAVGEVFFLKDL